MGGIEQWFPDTDPHTREHHLGVGGQAGQRSGWGSRGTNYVDLALCTEYGVGTVMLKYNSYMQSVSYSHSQLPINK